MSDIHGGAVAVSDAVRHAWAATPSPQMSRRAFITTNARDVRNLDF